MYIYWLIIFFFIGTLMGSFYTVVGIRSGRNEDYIKTRSKCDNCGHLLGPLDLVPIFSYIFLKGKCRYCHHKIDSLSTFMELFSGILYTLAFFVFGFSYELLIALGIISLLIIIIVSDTTYYIIPDEVLIFMSIYFFIFISLSEGFKSGLISLVNGFLLFLIMYIIMLVGNKLFKRESLGGGDIKLMFIFGMILGPLLGIVSIFIGSCLALPISLIITIKKKKNIIPFGPFLVIALTLLYMTGINEQLVFKFLGIL